MSRALGLLAVAPCIAACGGAPAPATGDAFIQAAQPTASSTVPAPAETSSPTPAPAPSDPADPSEEKLRASKALDETLPDIDDVTAELGPPSAQGKVTRRQWWYDAEPGRGASCSTVDLIRLPSGGVTFVTSILVSPDCIKAKKTKEAHVEAVVDGIAAGAVSAGAELGLDRLATRTFDEVAAAFQAKLGPPRNAGEPELAAWRYVDPEGACRLVVVVHRLGTSAGQAIWGAPCE